MQTENYFVCNIYGIKNYKIYKHEYTEFDYHKCLLNRIEWLCFTAFYTVHEILKLFQPLNFTIFYCNVLSRDHFPDFSDD